MCQGCEGQTGRLADTSHLSTTTLSFSLGSPLPTTPQIGSYFGSELCPLDTDGDGTTDVLLVAAPMFLGPQNKETGRVYVYLVGQVRLAGIPLNLSVEGGGRKGGKAHPFTGWLRGWDCQVSIFCRLPPPAGLADTPGNTSARTPPGCSVWLCHGCPS